MDDLNKLLFLVKEQFENNSNLDLQIETNFKVLDDFDSLTGMCILVAIKDEFGKEVNEEEFRKISSVKELYNLIR